jgi:hypothetical protein
MTLKMAGLRSSQRSNFQPRTSAGSTATCDFVCWQKSRVTRIFSRCLRGSIPYPHGYERGAGVGLDRGTGVDLGVVVAVAVAVGVGVGVAVELAVAVGVAVGVALDCAQYLPPVLK